MTEDRTSQGLGLTEYLQAASCLKDISVRSWYITRAGIWTPEVFLGLARNQSAQSLKTPNIPYHWISSLGEFSPETLFRNIHRISTTLCETGLSRLAPFLGSVGDLNLRVLGPSSAILRIVASIPTLRSLQVSWQNGYETGTIHGGDLLLLAENCPGLDLLHVRGNNLVVGADINDATIDKLARLLPKLKEIELRLVKTSLTGNALLSLGLHCKGLENCKINARLSYDTFLRVDRSNLFPALHTLQTFQREVITLPSDPVATALRLCQAAPVLRCFDYYDDYYSFEDNPEFHSAILKAYSEINVDINIGLY